ncbi:porphobilinogen deaminase [Venturia nashicola]|uniref:Porphobilinogen deaminase n=1 Tax=Venturia nashicola TaxID=86259 RepID=A0A4Z1P3E5_9PEZI|nr:porphobilinogen deaminase [Venturia nashicola]TLD29393.1 porphobilinogen deaminase [Venturia nashicola]
MDASIPPPLETAPSVTTYHPLSPSASAEQTKTITIGTRRSKLARVQTDLVLAALQKEYPSYTYKIHAMDPLGDRDKITALYSFNAKSLWTHELEALLEVGDLELIVHSLKDMPTQLPPNMAIGAILPREDPRDALCLSLPLTKSLPAASSGSAHEILSTLPAGSLIGTSSLRRQAQLKRAHPHLTFADCRGNVPTRLRKLDDPKSFTDQDVPEFAALILAAAGLIRLELGHRITASLSKKEGGVMHAVGQGAIGVEIRKDDKQTAALLSTLSCWKTERACIAERSLMRTLEGGCSVPIGVETEWTAEDELLMRGTVVSIDGSEAVESEHKASVKSREEADAFGREVARQLVDQGADKILKNITLNRTIIEEQGQA